MKELELIKTFFCKHRIVLVKTKHGDCICCKKCQYTLYPFITGYAKIERTPALQELLNKTPTEIL